jgi:glycosyltransferase involved in cell wall biosynthesis
MPPSSKPLNPELQVAIIIPCYNEQHTISEVVSDFKTALPNAAVYVFDNNSTDNTADVARSVGAKVVHVTRQGKGNVVRRMFADVDADVYLMVDGDSTYDASFAPQMVNKLLTDNLDMVIGCRIDAGETENYRAGHRFGNRMITGTVRYIFGGEFTDMLSGYRAFSRRYVKSFPAITSGFEIETELTIHALELKMPFAEIETTYGSRPDGSNSKLSTYKDGFRILKTILRLYMIERPLEFFSLVAIMLASLAVVLAMPLFVEYFATGLVPRLPTAVLCVGLMLSAQLAFVCGIVLDTVTRGRLELRRLAYLTVQGLPID